MDDSFHEHHFTSRTKQCSQTTAPPSGEAKNCITVLITEQLNWDKCGKTASLSHSTLLTLQLEIFLYKLSDS